MLKSSRLLKSTLKLLANAFDLVRLTITVIHAESKSKVQASKEKYMTTLEMIKFWILQSIVPVVLGLVCLALLMGGCFLAVAIQDIWRRWKK